MAAIVTAVVLGGCGEEPAEPCPHLAAWSEEVRVNTGDELDDVCLPYRLNRNSSGEVTCDVVEIIDPDIVATCEEIPGRISDGIDDELLRPRCVVTQIPIDGAGNPTDPARTQGWFYDDLSVDVLTLCEDTPQRISFTAGAEPRTGSVVKLACIVSLQGQGDVVEVGTSCAADRTICDSASASAIRDFPMGLGCQTANTLTCQPRCRSAADCPADYNCYDADGAGFLPGFCIDPRCSFARP